MGAEHNVKGLKPLAFTISEIPHSIFSKHIFGENVAFFYFRTPIIPPNMVFGGAEHNGKGLKALEFTISEIPFSIFSKHIYA